MKKTPNLELPVYDTPSVDTFRVDDWNKANENIDYVFGELKNNPNVNAIDIKAREDIINNHRSITEQMDHIAQEMELKKADRTQTDSMQQQINNLVINGDGTQNLEVVQARGGKKVINDRLIDIEECKRLNLSNSADIKYGAKKYINFEWESGQIGASTGADGDNANIIRTKGFLIPTDDVVVYILNSDIYKYGVWKYNMDGTYISTNAYIYASCKLKTGYKYRICLTKKIAENLSQQIEVVSKNILATEGVSELSKKVSKEDVSKNINLKDTPIEFNAKKFIHTNWYSGQINVSDGSVGSNVNKIITDFIDVEELLKIHLFDENFKYVVFKYNINGTYISNTGYMSIDSSYDKGFKYKVMFNGKVESDISNQIDTISQKISFLDGVIENFETLSAKKIDVDKVSQSIDYDLLATTFNGKRIIIPQFELGSIGTSNGQPNVSSTVIRTKDFFTPKDNLTFLQLDSDNFKFGVFSYNLDGTLSNFEAWIQNDKKEIIFDSTKKYKIMITKKDNANLTNIVDDVAKKILILDGNSYSEKDIHIVPERPCGWYEPILVISGANQDTLQANEIYSGYDTLVSANSGYVTRTLLGNDQSNAFPIYKYEFNPTEIETTAMSSKLPNIVIFTGTHGAEKGSTLSLLNLMKDVCTNWKNNNLLEYLRWNVRFVIVPVLNPYAMNNNVRWNVNHVDLNRNSGYMWHNGDSNPTSSQYRGTAPFSEIESQYAKGVIESNLDASVVIDYHTMGGEGNTWDKLLYCALTANNKDKSCDIATKYMIGKMTRVSQKKYDVPVDSGYIGHTEYFTNMGYLSNYSSHLGLQSMVVECAEKFPNTNRLDAKVIKFDTEYIGNFIVALINKLFY